MDNTNEPTFMQMLQRVKDESPKRTLEELMKEMKKMRDDEIVDIVIKKY